MAAGPTALPLMDGTHSGLRIGIDPGLRNIPHLASFLGVPEPRFQAVDSRYAELYVGWANTPSGKRARAAAAATGRPFVLLADGFLRSVRPPGQGGEPPIGLCLDDRGFHGDPSGPSRLEQLIAERAGTTPSPQAETLVAFLRQHRISKRNNFDAEAALDLPAGEASSRVLVVDQTDASASDLAGMLDAACDENPGALIAIRPRPGALSDSPLIEAARKRGCTIIPASLNPWSLLERFGRVYSVSSHLGFEALLAGRRVRCFGLPFYAGWGLTDDEITCPRRSAPGVSAMTLAEAAFIAYCRYVDPFTGEQIDADAAAHQLLERRDRFQQNRRIGAFDRVTLWKRATVRRMFDGGRDERMFFWTGKGARVAAKARGRGLAVWASKIDDRLEAECKADGVPILRIEDGFIRSVGLGTNFHQPSSLVLDDRGIYYDCRTPSRLEAILNSVEFDAALRARAARLIEMLIVKDITKYNLAEAQPNPNIPRDRTVILVPGQVEDDASIRFGGASLTSLEHLAAVRKDNPAAFIIFKPHPDVIAGQRPGLSDPAAARRFADLYAESHSITSLIASAAEAHAITSLAGFEALLRGKKVVCYGLPFYAGWGLTDDRLPCPRRARRLTLEELVAGVLILYPHYFDGRTGLLCGPEVVVRRIEDERRSPSAPNMAIRLRTLWGVLRRNSVSR